MRDMTLVGLSKSQGAADLLEWHQNMPGMETFEPTFRRLQLEHWIWSSRDEFGEDVLDVWPDVERVWLGDGYHVLGNDDDGDAQELPFDDESFTGVLLTDVLQHCEEPRLAMAEAKRVLKPGGKLLAASPFLWSSTNLRPDYWRITRDGWVLLLQGFTKASIRACAWTDEGEQMYDLTRRFEGWGFDKSVLGHTGYMCMACK